MTFHRRHHPGQKQRRSTVVHSAVGAGLALGIAGLASGQEVPNSSLYSGKIPTVQVRLARQPDSGELLPPGNATPPPPTSWYEIPPPPQKIVKVHDIVTIRVDTGAWLSTSAQLQNRRTAQYDARLNDWVILDGLKAVKPAPQTEGDQRIQGNLNQLDRSTGQLDTTESLKFDIAATVAAILPNGNVVLEAHSTVRNNDEHWLHSLSGVCRREDIGPGNLILSKDIANLQVEKRELGQMRDSYKRGWFTRWFDQFDPF